MQIQKLTVDIENGKYHTGYGDQVVVTVTVKAWDAPDFCFRNMIQLDSFETGFDRFMEIARRSIQAEVERIKGDQMPYEERLAESLAAMQKRNEGRVQGA